MTETLYSPLHSKHEELGASFTMFGAWEMPLKYGNELDEHRAVREAAGLFDLSHMGEIIVSGSQATEYLNYAFIADYSKLTVGRAKYNHMVEKDGRIIDDLIIYHVEDGIFWVVPNAGNAETVWENMVERKGDFDVTLENKNREISNIACQGPNSEAVLKEVIPEDEHEKLENLKYYAAEYHTVAGEKVLVARTGYTGEDGFELYIENEKAAKLWDALLEAGKDHGLLPCGLAARDSLRLEAGMPLYGHELTHDLTTVDAGMRGITGKEKEGDFYGKVLLDLPVSPNKLTNMVGEGRRAAREGAKLFDPEGNEVGYVTSGQLSPTLGYPIAMGYVKRDAAAEGAKLEADIRGKRYPYTVVKGAFYKRDK